MIMQDQVVVSISSRKIERVISWYITSPCSERDEYRVAFCSRSKVAPILKYIAAPDGTTSMCFIIFKGSAVKPPIRDTPKEDKNKLDKLKVTVADFKSY